VVLANAGAKRFAFETNSAHKTGNQTQAYGPVVLTQSRSMWLEVQDLHTLAYFGVLVSAGVDTDCKQQI